ncbi:PST-A protein [Plasmodium ovale curtisi]|uniref:PST-A protein n=1 Tax=Plasmodium ovale curtisi TaxID=864141 RepID=A0A1A8VZS2_PLAOA|nr:PST-A protein [Plasmodium ovale curtisi]SBS96457.1 PST-A protein [Plasmodium ovale curtisi]
MTEIKKKSESMSKANNENDVKKLCEKAYDERSNSSTAVVNAERKNNDPNKSDSRNGSTSRDNGNVEKNDDATPKKKSKNSINEGGNAVRNRLLYDDGNPEISYFVNKDNLKIARYAWKTENPKAYVFALHGITSHLRNEYLNYMGRPRWVAERGLSKEGSAYQHTQSDGNLEKDEYKMEEGNNCGGANSKNGKEQQPSREALSASLDEVNNQASYPMHRKLNMDNTFQKNDTPDSNIIIREHVHNLSNDDVNAKSNETNATDHAKKSERKGTNMYCEKMEVERKEEKNCSKCTHSEFSTISENENKNTSGEKYISNKEDSLKNDNHLSSPVNVNSAGGSSTFDGISSNGNNRVSIGNGLITLQPSISLIKEKIKNLNRETKSFLSESNSSDDNDERDRSESDSSSLSCTSSELGDKRNLEKKLTMFLSCSSCISNMNENTNNINNRFNDSSMSDDDLINDHMIDDENVLLPSNEDTVKYYDTNVYYCSVCGICEYCNCGPRKLSYKNSWIEKLNQNNFSFFGIDNQSHGLSEGVKNYRCYIEDFNNFVSDTIQALEILINEWKEKNELKPIIIMGLSMGGCIALKTLEAIFRFNKEWKSYVKSLVLISPMISLGKQKNKISNRLLISATKFLKYFFPLLPVNVKESNGMYPWIKHDSEIDPYQYCGPIRVRIAAECVSAADSCLTYKNLKYIEEGDIDLIVIQSKHDCIVDPIGAIDIIRKLVRLNNRRHKKHRGKSMERDRMKYNTNLIFPQHNMNMEKKDSKRRSNDANIDNNNSTWEGEITSIEKSKDIDSSGSNDIKTEPTDTINYGHNKFLRRETEDGKENPNDKSSPFLKKGIMDGVREGNLNTRSNMESCDKKEDQDSLSNTIIFRETPNRTGNQYTVCNSFPNSENNSRKNEKGAWNTFDHGYYKSVKLKRGISSRGFNIGETNIECGKKFKGEDTALNDGNFKNISVYILKYGCHTLPGEPDTKKTITILVDWLNNICE